MKDTTTASDLLHHDVVIAEDDHDDYEILNDVIQNLPLKVIVTRAENGDFLMKLIHEKTPDIIFLDIVMPCRDGKACIQEIRSDRKFDNVPIIVYTSLKDLDTIEFCFRSGSNLYVHKPNTYSEIVDVVRKIFALNWKKAHYFPVRSEYVLNPMAML